MRRGLEIPATVSSPSLATSPPDNRRDCRTPHRPGALDPGGLCPGGKPTREPAAGRRGHRAGAGYDDPGAGGARVRGGDGGGPMGAADTLYRTARRFGDEAPQRVSETPRTDSVRCPGRTRGDANDLVGQWTRPRTGRPALIDTSREPRRADPPSNWASRMALPSAHAPTGTRSWRRCRKMGETTSDALVERHPTPGRSCPPPLPYL